MFNTLDKVFDKDVVLLVDHIYSRISQRTCNFLKFLSSIRLKHKIYPFKCEMSKFESRNDNVIIPGLKYRMNDLDDFLKFLLRYFKLGISCYKKRIVRYMIILNNRKIINRHDVYFPDFDSLILNIFYWVISTRKMKERKLSKKHLILNFKYNRKSIKFTNSRYNIRNFEILSQKSNSLNFTLQINFKSNFSSEIESNPAPKYKSLQKYIPVINIVSNKKYTTNLLTRINLSSISKYKFLQKYIPAENLVSNTKYKLNLATRIESNKVSKTGNSRKSPQKHYKLAKKYPNSVSRSSLRYIPNSLFDCRNTIFRISLLPKIFIFLIFCLLNALKDDHLRYDVNNTNIFHESIYDPLIFNDSFTSISKKEKIRDVKGYFSHHFPDINYYYTDDLDSCSSEIETKNNINSDDSNIKKSLNGSKSYQNEIDSYKNHTNKNSRSKSDLLDDDLSDSPESINNKNKKNSRSKSDLLDDDLSDSPESINNKNKKNSRSKSDLLDDDLSDSPESINNKNKKNSRSKSGLLDDDLSDSPESINNKKNDYTKLLLFGDLSLLTLNLYKDISVPEEDEYEISRIVNLIDRIHPTIFCIQGIDISRLSLLLSLLNDNIHYSIINYDRSSFDYKTGDKIYFPIIYDNDIVSLKDSGYFETDENVPRIYASHAEFIDYRLNNKDSKEKKDLSYTIINGDLYSSFSDVVEAMFLNISKDVVSVPEINNSPVIYMGGLGSLSSILSYMIDISYHNTITMDCNNSGLRLTTDHTKGNDDNVQRDFILIRDNNVFTVNYSRILRGFSEEENWSGTVEEKKKSNSKDNTKDIYDAKDISNNTKDIDNTNKRIDLQNIQEVRRKGHINRYPIHTILSFNANIQRKKKEESEEYYKEEKWKESEVQKRLRKEMKKYKDKDSVDLEKIESKIRIEVAKESEERLIKAEVEKERKEEENLEQSIESNKESEDRSIKLELEKERKEEVDLERSIESNKEREDGSIKGSGSLSSIDESETDDKYLHGSKDMRRNSSSLIDRKRKREYESDEDSRDITYSKENEGGDRKVKEGYGDSEEIKSKSGYSNKEGQPDSEDIKVRSGYGDKEDQPDSKETKVSRGYSDKEDQPDTQEINVKGEYGDKEDQPDIDDKEPGIDENNQSDSKDKKVKGYIDNKEDQPDINDRKTGTEENHILDTKEINDRKSKGEKDNQPDSLEGSEDLGDKDTKSKGGYHGIKENIPDLKDEKADTSMKDKDMRDIIDNDPGLKESASINNPSKNKEEGTLKDSGKEYDDNDKVMSDDNNRKNVGPSANLKEGSKPKEKNILDSREIPDSTDIKEQNDIDLPTDKISDTKAGEAKDNKPGDNLNVEPINDIQSGNNPKPGDKSNVAPINDTKPGNNHNVDPIYDTKPDNQPIPDQQDTTNTPKKIGSEITVSEPNEPDIRTVEIKGKIPTEEEIINNGPEDVKKEYMDRKKRVNSLVSTLFEPGQIENELKNVNGFKEEIDRKKEESEKILRDQCKPEVFKVLMDSGIASTNPLMGNSNILSFMDHAGIGDSKYTVGPNDNNLGRVKNQNLECNNNNNNWNTIPSQGIVLGTNGIQNSNIIPNGNSTGNVLPQSNVIDTKNISYGSNLGYNNNLVNNTPQNTVVTSNVVPNTDNLGFNNNLVEKAVPNNTLGTKNVQNTYNLGFNKNILYNTQQKNASNKNYIHENSNSGYNNLTQIPAQNNGLNISNIPKMSSLVHNNPTKTIPQNKILNVNNIPQTLNFGYNNLTKVGSQNNTVNANKIAQINTSGYNDIGEISSSNSAIGTTNNQGTNNLQVKNNTPIRKTAPNIKIIPKPQKLTVTDNIKPLCSVSKNNSLQTVPMKYSVYSKTSNTPTRLPTVCKSNINRPPISTKPINTKNKLEKNINPLFNETKGYKPSNLKLRPVKETKLSNLVQQNKSPDYNGNGKEIKSFRNLVSKNNSTGQDVSHTPLINNSTLSNTKPGYNTTSKGVGKINNLALKRPKVVVYKTVMKIIHENTGKNSEKSGQNIPKTVFINESLKPNQENIIVTDSNLNKKPEENLNKKVDVLKETKNYGGKGDLCEGLAISKLYNLNNIPPSGQLTVKSDVYNTNSKLITKQETSKGKINREFNESILKPAINVQYNQNMGTSDKNNRYMEHNGGDQAYNIPKEKFLNFYTNKILKPAVPIDFQEQQKTSIQDNSENIIVLNNDQEAKDKILKDYVNKIIKPSIPTTFQRNNDEIIKNKISTPIESGINNNKSSNQIIYEKYNNAILKPSINAQYNPLCSKTSNENKITFDENKNPIYKGRRLTKQEIKQRFFVRYLTPSGETVEPIESLWTPAEKDTDNISSIIGNKNTVGSFTSGSNPGFVFFDNAGTDRPSGSIYMQDIEADNSKRVGLADLIKKC